MWKIRVTSYMLTSIKKPCKRTVCFLSLDNAEMLHLYKSQSNMILFKNPFEIQIKFTSVCYILSSMIKKCLLMYVYQINKVYVVFPKRFLYLHQMEKGEHIEIYIYLFKKMSHFMFCIAFY
ncbi:hypothetical protein BLD50_00410 [Bacillus cereus]|nr:hypothetical protein BLD50_00410 [Bacillus cereus]